MNATERPVSGDPKQIWFSNGNSALVCRDDGSEAGQLVAALGLGPDETGRPVLVVSGGADTLKGAHLDRAEEMLGTAVPAATGLAGAAVVDGGTSAGVMAVIGAARARRPEAMPVLLGVAPEDLVSYPGRSRDDGVPLDPQHTHFVLADSGEWGGETALLISVAAGLAGPGPVVVLLAGGGPVAKSDVLAAVRRGWPVFAVAGTGGLADDILARRDAARAGSRRPVPRRGQPRGSAGPADDPDLREILGQGDIREVTGAPGALARDLAWALQPEPVLKEAWREFATYDHLAKKLRATFTRAQASILALGVAATLVALVYNEWRQPVLHWLAVALPILVSVLIALASRHAVGQRWVMLRAAAEAIKAEIFRYRTRTPPYASADQEERQLALSEQVDAIQAQLIQTEVSSGRLTPYDGPLPPVMYGACADDDGLSPLGGERYLHIRLRDQLGWYHGKVARLGRQRSWLQAAAIGSGGAGALLAAAGFEIWVGLTGGVGAAVLAYLGSLQVENTIVTYNQAATKLAGLERGWTARRPADRTDRVVTDLVTRAEELMTAELAGWVRQMNDAMQETLKRQAEEARAAGSGHAPPSAPEDASPRRS
ncbi:MAG: DUF4231 domain-containing protein [Streptosporangiales bacterium]